VGRGCDCQPPPHLYDYIRLRIYTLIHISLDLSRVSLYSETGQNRAMLCLWGICNGQTKKSPRKGARVERLTVYLSRNLSSIFIKASAATLTNTSGPSTTAKIMQVIIKKLTPYCLQVQTAKTEWRKGSPYYRV